VLGFLLVHLGKNKGLEMEKDRTPEISQEKCPECGSINLIHDYETHETACANCGLVIRDQEMDRGPEWRAFDPEQKEKRIRTGPPETITIHDMGLSTIISHTDYDAFGRKLPASTKYERKRLRKWQRRVRASDATERNLATAMTEIDRISDHLSLTQPFKEEAALIYRKAIKAGLVRGRSITAVVAACLYAACRIKGQPRSFEEIAKVSRLRRKEIARCYRTLYWKLNLEVPTVNALDHIEKTAKKADITRKSQAIAENIIRQAQRIQLTDGKSPVGVVAAALYIACTKTGEDKTRRKNQRAIARAANVTEVTVRNLYKPLKVATDIIDLIEKADLGDEIQELAINIFQKAKEKDLFSNKNRELTSIAAAIVYIACEELGERKSIKEIANAAGVTRVTVKNRYKELIKELDLELPKIPIMSEGQIVPLSLSFFI